MTDVTEEIDAVGRVVGTRELEAGEAKVVTLSRAFDVPVEEAWDACTSPERIPRWFLPVSGDLRPGGRYRLEGNAAGTIERCEPPRLLHVTWEFGGSITGVEVRLDEEPSGRTRLRLDHVGEVGDERWAQFGPAAVGIGWDTTLHGLALHLATGASPAADGAAWMASEEGLRFMTLSGERWREADVAAGTPEEQARAAAQRTIAAYTGADG